MASPRFLSAVLLSCLILVVVALYLYGAMQQFVRVNTDLTRMDQGAYMNFTRQVYESGFTYTGTRNRMPVYPFLQALFYRPGLSEQAAFERGKYVNLFLSLVLLGGLAVIHRRFFDRLHALNLTLIVAFTVFIFKAGWYQAELLFYTVNFCLFLLFWRLLQRPAPGWAALTGAVAGVAHLTKASVLPGLAIFLAVLAASWFVGLARGRSGRAGGGRRVGESARPLVTLLLVGAVFLAVVFPYISESKRIYGRYFYNVNSTFYMWYDSWDEAKAGTRAAGDREGWPDLPPEQIPSPRKYLREHTPAQIVARVVDGGREVLRNSLSSYGYATYIALYGAFLLAAVIWQRARAVRLARENAARVGFTLLYFAAYALLYAWYAPIAAGPRLVLAQYMPLLFALSMGLRALLHSQQVRIGRPVPALTLINLIVLAVLVVDIYSVLTVRAGTVYGGA